jgi:hypothetical protein
MPWKTLFFMVFQLLSFLPPLCEKSFQKPLKQNSLGTEVNFIWFFTVMPRIKKIFLEICKASSIYYFQNYKNIQLFSVSGFSEQIV